LNTIVISKFQVHVPVPSTHHHAPPNRVTPALHSALPGLLATIIYSLLAPTLPRLIVAVVQRLKALSRRDSTMHKAHPRLFRPHHHRCHHQGRVATILFTYQASSLESVRSPRVAPSHSTPGVVESHLFTCDRGCLPKPERVHWILPIALHTNRRRIINRSRPCSTGPAFHVHLFSSAPSPHLPYS